MQESPVLGFHMYCVP